VKRFLLWNVHLWKITLNVLEVVLETTEVFEVEGSALTQVK